jgi:2,3-bisphosphoglycerate-independent phosphoglycerate mutase
VPETPSFEKQYGLKAAITSAVDLLRGLGMMMGMTILEIPGVTDNLQNDFAGQAERALAALKDHDLVVIHVEAPDEAGHAGRADEKILSIEKIDSLVVSQLRAQKDLRLLILPDHPTPVSARTHVAEPVPFLMQGPGFVSNGARRFTEAEAKYTGVSIEKGYNIINEFIK